MARRYNEQLRTILNAKGATGVGTTLDVEDFRHIMLEVATDGGGDANLTVKFQGSISDDAPTFSAAQSASNMWDYILTYDLEDGSAIDGDTGFVVAGADDYRLLLMNVDGLKWINARVTARSAGEVTVKAKCFNDLSMGFRNVMKNLMSSTTINGDYICRSDGDTGGTGSAGAGSQYVEIEINGTVYKILHDGTV